MSFLKLRTVTMSMLCIFLCGYISSAEADYLKLTDMCIVKVDRCFQESKYGKYKMEAFTKFRDQMLGMYNDKVKEHKECSALLEDDLYLSCCEDSESRKAILRNQKGKLERDLPMISSQVQNSLASENEKMTLEFKQYISKASNQLIQEKGYYMLFTSDVLLASHLSDVTDSLIEVMDKIFDEKYSDDNITL